MDLNSVASINQANLATKLKIWVLWLKRKTEYQELTTKALKCLFVKTDPQWQKLNEQNQASH